MLDLIDPERQAALGAQRRRVKQLLGLLAEADCELPPESAVAGAVLLGQGRRPAYLDAREADRRAVGAYLAESADAGPSAGDADGAVRVLSSIIEEHPSRGDALRLVGYRLLDLQQPAQAAGLFSQVQRQRPFEPHSYRDLARAWRSRAGCRSRPRATRSCWRAPGTAASATRSRS